MVNQSEVGVTGTSSSQIRVLFVAHDAQLHGAQLTLLNILRNLDRSQFIPFVVSPQAGPFTDEVSRLGIPFSTGLVMRWVFQRSHVSFMGTLSAPWKLIRTPAIIALFICGLPVRLGRLLLLLHRHKIDVIYTNTITVIDGAIAAKLSHRPHIWHLHENIDVSKNLLKVLPGKNVVYLLALKLSSLIVVPSNVLRDQIFDDRLSMRKVKVIHNGVDANRFGPHLPSDFLHQELGIPFGAPLVGICGAIQESKGHEFFVKAAAEVSKKFPSTHFVIIGEGRSPYVRFITDLANRCGLSGKLHFIGWRADIPEIFRDLKIIVIASKQEAFGLTAIEGMATGIPIVATRCGGPEEVIEHGSNGYLVALGDPLEMAQRILELLASAELRQRMGRAGREQVEQRYRIELCAKQVEQVITLVASQMHH